MNYRQIGKSGIQVSEIGLGTNQFGTDQVDQSKVDEIINTAEDLGINFIDTANIYTNGISEQMLGKSLQGRWNRFIVATKFSMKNGPGPNDRGASRYHILNSVEDSLKRLKSNHIDLYYVHRWDDITPIEETLSTLDSLIQAGKVRYIGGSAFFSWQLARANLLAEIHGWSHFIAMQSHYHMLERSVEAEMLPLCQDQGIGFIPYFPLAGGFLTGKYREGEQAPPGSRGNTNKYVQDYMTSKNFKTIGKLYQFAKTAGHSIAEVAQSWLLSNKEVSSVITGAKDASQIKANSLATNWKLNEDDIKEIETIIN